MVYVHSSKKWWLFFIPFWWKFFKERENIRNFLNVKRIFSSGGFIISVHTSIAMKYIRFRRNSVSQSLVFPWHENLEFTFIINRVVSAGTLIKTRKRTITTRQHDKWGHSEAGSQQGFVTKRLKNGSWCLFACFPKKNQSTMNNGFQVRIIIQDYKYTQNNYFLYICSTSLTTVFKV